MLGRFNGFLKSVILRINEARDLGEVDRFAFYDHMKVYTAAPPDVLRVDEKNLREHSVFNVCGVDHHHQPQDRRHLSAGRRPPAFRGLVASSPRTTSPTIIGTTSGAGMRRGGMRHVAAYLARLDLSDFNPKAPPPKTAAFWDIVDANRAPEDAELADVLDRLGNPDATTLIRHHQRARGDFEDWSRTARTGALSRIGWKLAAMSPCCNETAKDGLWVINGKRQRIYAKAALAPRDRFKAASALMASSNYGKPEEDER